tara:strand:- start:1646 stop:2704 length:1059 start_codon:yes stop_codon:yes gene_type:complete
MSQKSLIVRKVNHKNLISYLKIKKIRKIYNSFKKNIISNKINENLAVAISGGPDSLALTFLVKCLSEEIKLKVLYLHVNHKLRNESGKEALFLKKKLKLFGIDIKILNWNGVKPNSNIQSKARKIRYDLILKEINKKKITKILVGHTQEDVLENFFIRLVRGSGLHGFVSLNNKISQIGKYTLVRPLINIKKEELIYISNKVFKFYIKDISNDDEKYTRVRIRKLIEHLSKEGLDTKKINLSLFNLKSSNDIINFYVNKNILQNSKLITQKKMFFLNNLFFIQPNEIIFRSLNIILKEINGKYYPPRGKKVINLIKSIKNSKSKKITISRCVIEKLQNSYLIYSENQKKVIN